MASSSGAVENRQSRSAKQTTPCCDRSGRWNALLTTTGSGGTFASVSGAIAPIGSTQYVALVNDGSSTLSLYACTPGATGVTAATKAVTGTIVQPASSDLAIGLMSGGWKYNGVVPVGSINGKVYSVRVSNVARQSGAITCPNASFASDSNTMVLTNGETAPGSPTPPFIKGYDGQAIAARGASDGSRLIILQGRETPA